MRQTQVPPLTAERLIPSIGPARVAAFSETLRQVAAALRGRRLVIVTGDDRGKGGVYEIFRSTLPYLRGAGIDVTWMNLPTPPQARPALEFFHVLAHGRPPVDDWESLADQRADEFVEFGRAAAHQISPFLSRRDIVVLNDTQTSAVIPHMPVAYEHLVWHAHIGTTAQNELVSHYWDVVAPWVERAKTLVFYRPEYAPTRLHGTSAFVTPGVDPSSAKSSSLDLGMARRLLESPPPSGSIEWTSETSPGFGASDVVVAQLSRWDPLKDMPGVVRAVGLAARSDGSIRGLIAGPDAQSESEQLELRKTLDEYERLPAEIRRRIHIAIIRQCGTAQHDAAVRVIQCSADLILQKSVEEGFGLTVTEGMLRAKAVVAADVGGISLQIRDGYSGILLAPRAPDDQWARCIADLASDPDRRLRIGGSARASVLESHTVDRYISTAVDRVGAMMAR